jgi:hypothetical protein
MVLEDVDEVRLASESMKTAGFLCVRRERARHSVTAVAVLRVALIWWE